MTPKEIKELIKNIVREFTGTGDSGGNSGDGNNITSPRVGGSFHTDEDEIEDYMYKSIYGGDGGHYKKYTKTNNFNSLNKQGMFELKEFIKKTLKEQAFGSATLTTQGTPRTGAIAPTDEYPFSVRPKRTATGMMEFKQPKSFDPDTINLVRDMLSMADIHHNELVGGYDEVSSYLDKRSGGTYIKFPHFNGPQGRGAMFGKETADKIDRSKAAAKAAALKTYTQFKDYIEDYEISDVSPGGVYGNAYLFLIFNELAKDYTAPKGGTQSSQFETIEEEEVHGKEIVITAGGLKKSIEFIGKHLKNLPNYASSKLFNLFKVDNIKALISNFPYNSEESKADLSKLKSLFKQMESEEAKNFGLEINKLHTDMKRKNLKEATCRQKSQELADSYSTEELQDRLDQIFRDMEQEAEPEGGPIADMYADEIDAYEGAIKIAKGGSDKPLTYGQATGQEPLPDGSYLDKDGNKTTVSPNKDTFTKSSKFDRLNEQVNPAEQKNFERGLKKLQKNVLKYQLKWMEKQRSAAISQSAIAGQEAGKGFDEQIKALQDQLSAIDNPPKEKQNENLNECDQCGGNCQGHKEDHEGRMAKSQLYKIYQYTERLMHMLPDNAQLPAWVQSKFTQAAHSIGAAFHYLDYQTMSYNDNLMENLEYYKKKVINESTLKKFFKMFNDGRTNKDIIKYYEGKGVSVPEQFLNKTRKQYENIKKQKLEIEFSEQEAKDVINTTIEVPDVQLFDLSDEKKMSNRLYKEAKIVKKFPIPSEIKDALVNTLKMNPIKRFVNNLKAVNSIPPSYRVFLLNGKSFDIIYEDYSLKVKIGIDEYYLADLEEKNYAVKHINRLLTEPSIKKGGEESEDIPSTSTPPSTEEPADEEPTT